MMQLSQVTNFKSQALDEWEGRRKFWYHSFGTWNIPGIAIDI